MSPNPKHTILDVPIGEPESPWDDPYAGAIPEITGDEVDAAFPTEMVEVPVHEQIAAALAGGRNVQRPTHEIAAWIRKTWQR